MFPTKITAAMKERIREVGRRQREARRLRRQAAELLRGLPSGAQLAREAEVSARRVQQMLADVRNNVECVVSRGAQDGRQ